MFELIYLSLLFSQSPQGQQIHAGVGRAVNRSELTARDLTVTPAGGNLPDGKGTARQGRALYVATCSVCHGVRGEGVNDYPPVAGGRDSLNTNAPILTVGSYWPLATTLWDYLRRSMPYERPGTLTADQIYALTAYVLFLNQIVGEDEILDRSTLPKVKMPNRDGFVRDVRPQP